MTTVSTVVTAKETGERLSPKEGIQFKARTAGQQADVQLQPR